MGHSAARRDGVDGGLEGGRGLAEGRPAASALSIWSRERERDATRQARLATHSCSLPDRLCESIIYLQ